MLQRRTPALRGNAFVAASLRWIAALVGFLATIAFLLTGFGPALLLFGIAMVIGAGAREFQSIVDRTEIRQRTADAQRTTQLLRAKRWPGSYFLYLRPFFSDMLLIENPWKSILPFLPSFHYPRRVPWESVFSKAVHDNDRMIALGMPSTSDGAARVQVVDEEWLQTFVMLATFADAIFVWPSTRASTKWEIEWLMANRQIDRCIFCVPEEYRRVMERSDETWLGVRAFLLAKGFNVPQETGVLFTVDPPRQMPLRIRRRRRFVRAVGTFVAPFRSSGVARRSDLWDVYEAAVRLLPKTLTSVSEREAPTLLTCAERGHLLPIGAIVCPICERMS